MKSLIKLLVPITLVMFSASFLTSCSNNADEYNENEENESSIVYNISISSGGNGSVAIKDYAETFISVKDGTSITLIATPDNGYKFMGYRVEESTTVANLGLSYTFNVSGDISLTAVFEKEEDLNTTIFTVVEAQPEFPGGMSALMKYLTENIVYPEIPKNNGKQGRAITQFVVQADGAITDVKLVKSIGEIFLDIEAVRVVSAMPNWICGKQDDIPVCVRFTMPVTFRLSN